MTPDAWMARLIRKHLWSKSELSSSLDEPSSDPEPDSDSGPSLGWDDGYTHGEGDADMPAFVMDQSKAA